LLHVALPAMFDDILLADDYAVREGFEEGRRAGREKAEKEGMDLGKVEGAKVGVRLAVYRGRLAAFRSLLTAHPSVFPQRAAHAMEQAEQSLAEVDACLQNPRDQAGFDALENVETRLRLLNSLLKLTGGPQNPPTLDF